MQRCQGCGFLTSTLVANIITVDESSDKMIDEAVRMQALKPIRQENFQKMIVFLKQLFKLKNMQQLRLLEVGSGHGWFLLEAQVAGFSCVGIEPSQSVNMDPALRASSIEIRSGLFPEICGDKENFDAIVFNDVFEHLPQIDKVLAACKQHLSAGGYLIINLPNSKGFFYRCSALLAHFGIVTPLERLWQKGLPSPHLLYFNPHQLKKLLAKHGFLSVGEVSLAALSVRGLWKRIRYVSQFSVPTATIVYAAVLVLYPVLLWLPNDIHCEYFKKEV